MLQQRYALGQEAAIGEVAGDRFRRTHNHQRELVELSGRMERKARSVCSPWRFAMASR
jgi:hypothetical protein